MSWDSVVIIDKYAKDKIGTYEHQCVYQFLFDVCSIHSMNPLIFFKSPNNIKRFFINMKHTLTSWLIKRSLLSIKKKNTIED